MKMASRSFGYPAITALWFFDKNTKNIKVYLPQNGIAHEEFNRYSHFQDKDGTLYFGGLSGITKFHPADFRESVGAVAPLYITGIRVLEKNAEAYTDKMPAYKLSRKISMNPTDRIVELEITLLDYKKSKGHQYAYKLNEKQDQWIYTQENKFSIINPPYGRYNLHIKGRSASGKWSEKPLIIPMHVKYPVYFQWWFILIALSVLIAIVIIAVHWRIQKLEKSRSRLEAEVRKRTDKIEKQTQALKALDKAKSRFFANITHEFRTPLTLIIGPAEQLISKEPPSPFKKSLYEILKNARNLLELINQLLDLSKLESSQMKIEFSHGDIVHFTREHVVQFQYWADRNKLHLEFTSDLEAWEIGFDRDKWSKILFNLISNAIKFTPEGGSITIDLKKLRLNEQDFVQLRVKDTGIGIEKEYLNYIYDRFYQVDASSTRVRGGTGIGLALVKELVDIQDGTITVNSFPAKGTLFNVRLPVTSEFDAKKLISPLLSEDMFLNLDTYRPQTKNNQTDTGTKKITAEKLELLIIEDNAEMRTYIRSCIDVSAFHISEAVDGAAGIEKAQKIIPDLIISDVMMPKKDGFEVTEAIRNHTATSHIPVILLTAKAALKSRLEGLERGADAYLIKPFSPQELAMRIQKLIELRRLLQARYRSGIPPPEDIVFKKEDAFITEIKAYIRANMSKTSLSTSEISAHFVMSRMQLHRKIKDLTDNSAHYYIQSIRLDTAMKMVKEKKFSIAEIADETGFSSPENLTRAFKKVFGKAPSKIG